MSLNLSGYTSLQSNLFIKLGLYINGAVEYQYFSDYSRVITIAGDAYTGLGQLMAVTDSSSDLRITPYELTVSLSGIPSANVNMVTTVGVKGASIEIRRGIFDPVTGELLNITGNPAGRFFGVVSNYSINEDFPDGSKDSSVTVSLICSSNVSQLERKLAGRSTNPTSQKGFYPGDTSMNRVPNIANANYNFGAPV